MEREQLSEKKNLPISQMAQTLQGSEIIKLAGEINDKIKKGDTIYNYTIGDFDPQIFPIPSLLKANIIEAYKSNHTNYPAANGIESLRNAISAFILERQGLNYSPNEYLVASGARPLIYAAYQTLVDPGDKVVFPVPSWNNNHYSHLSGAKAVMIQTSPENNFMPSGDELKEHLKDATLLALCSPLNPTGTTFTKEGLLEICRLVLAENLSRSPEAKPLYLLYDQIYWALTFGETEHVDPVSLMPELRPYTIFIDGISKSFAATGVRVGWAFGPEFIIDRMKSILGHVGAWAPKAEQVATANFLQSKNEVDAYLAELKERLFRRLSVFYKGFKELKEEGLPVDVVAPQAAIYLTVSINLKGKTTPDGVLLKSTADTTQYILNEAGVAIVPFYAFGSPMNSTWYRLSVGTSNSDEIPRVIQSLRSAILKLRDY
jgi:aspartate aminotransferase